MKAMFNWLQGRHNPSEGPASEQGRLSATNSLPWPWPDRRRAVRGGLRMCCGRSAQARATTMTRTQRHRSYRLIQVSAKWAVINRRNAAYATRISAKISSQ